VNKITRSVRETLKIKHGVNFEIKRNDLNKNFILERHNISMNQGKFSFGWEDKHSRYRQLNPKSRKERCTKKNSGKL
jgi:hypothetical protein